MKVSVEGQRTGIQWNPSEQLEHLDLISVLHTYIGRTTKLHKLSKQWGLQINVRKTKVMRLNTKSHQPITMERPSREDVFEIVYLGSNISTDGRAEKDVDSNLLFSQLPTNTNNQSLINYKCLLTNVSDIYQGFGGSTDSGHTLQMDPRNLERPALDFKPKTKVQLEVVDT